MCNEIYSQAFLLNLWIHFDLKDAKGGSNSKHIKFDSDDDDDEEEDKKDDDDDEEEEESDKDSNDESDSSDGSVTIKKTKVSRNRWIFFWNLVWFD